LCTTSRDEAVQRWPLVPNAPHNEPSTALSISASSITMIAFLPPISSETILFSRAHCSAIMRPVSVEPVNEISRTSLCPTSVGPMSDPCPLIRFTTPFGTPAFSHALIRFKDERGTSSPDFNTTVLPQTSAGINFHDGIAIGKLKGVMSPQMPTG